MIDRYALVRGVARFRPVRTAVARGRGVALRSANRRFEADQRARLAESEFPDVDIDTAVREVVRDGLSTGLQLRADTVEELLRFADTHTVYADREADRGFRPDERAAAETALGKPILVAQYMNSRRDCPAIERIGRDPVLGLIALGVLGSMPRLVGSSLWWTYPVVTSEAERNLHAHLFHRDVDDFRFVKFFFYVTDLSDGDGAHVCVVGSHRHPPHIVRSDRYLLRRYSDAEIEAFYGPDAVRVIDGPVGSGFAEDTLCVHKALTPTHRPRLLLQYEFALFDHGVMHDHRTDAELALVAGGG